MQFVEGIRLALQQIWTEKLQSFFSLLGVSVGVMFLIVVVSIVEGLDRYIREDLASAVFGVNTVTLRRWSDGPDFGDEDESTVSDRSFVLRVKSDPDAYSRGVPVVVNSRIAA